MRPYLSWLGALVALASLYFFYRGVAFLAGRDYVAALLTILVGFALVKAGVELVRLVVRRETIEGEAIGRETIGSNASRRGDVRRREDA